MSNIKGTGIAQCSDSRNNSAQLAAFMTGYSIEVTPSTLGKVRVLSDVFPKGTHVFIAQIEGARFDAMLDTAVRLRECGYRPVPHIAARSIVNRAELETMLQRYRSEADVQQALLLAGGMKSFAGFENSMQMVETGLFDKLEFQRLFFAGHPEGSVDIDPDGGTQQLDSALSWKQAFAQSTDASVALVTQFGFNAETIIQWSRRIAGLGVDLPIHVGMAGPARMPTLMKYALSCGVGASLKALHKRALDFGKLMLPYSPESIASDLACYVAENPTSLIKKPHMFPFGGIDACVKWIRKVNQAAAHGNE